MQSVYTTSSTLYTDNTDAQNASGRHFTASDVDVDKKNYPEWESKFDNRHYLFKLLKTHKHMLQFMYCTV